VTPGRRRRAGADSASTQDTVESALQAGLTHVADSMPGISRRVTDNGFEYFGANGHRVTNPDKLKRIRALAVPPAWTDVWICPFATGHLQVTARDARGRKQYRYHPKYRAVRDDTKFDRMFEFSRQLPRIRRAVERDMLKRKLPREKVLATVVRLLEKTLIRVGNAEYAKENQSFGLTTLRADHVTVKGAEMRFSFRGKSGVVRQVSISDRRIARIVQRCQVLPGEELFQYVDDQGEPQVIGSGDINAYLRKITGRDITAKDFRTWAGTMLAAVALADEGPVRNKRNAKANILKAVDKVAERLGNTRVVCQKYYVHPRVFHAYMKGKVVDRVNAPAKRRKRPTLELRRQEIAVLDFLDID
jgi:DNA topoisomerase I